LTDFKRGSDAIGFDVVNLVYVGRRTGNSIALGHLNRSAGVNRFLAFTSGLEAQKAVTHLKRKDIDCAYLNDGSCLIAFRTTGVKKGQKSATREN
jgi:hypothetical protein